MQGTEIVSPSAKASGCPRSRRRKLVHPKVGFECRRDQFVGVSSDRDRNRQRLLLLEGPLGKLSQVIRRDDVDTGDIFLLEHQSVHTSVHAELRIFRERHHHACDADGKYRNRQLVEIDFVLL